MASCEKCWGDAFMRHISNPTKSQSEHYHDLLEERKDDPCNQDNDDIINRRIRLDLNKPAELAIYNAMQEVEKLPPDVRLTDAINNLHKAKDLVGDFIDEDILKIKQSRGF